MRYRPKKEDVLSAYVRRIRKISHLRNTPVVRFSANMVEIEKSVLDRLLNLLEDK